MSQLGGNVLGAIGDGLSTVGSVFTGLASRTYNGAKSLVGYGEQPAPAAETPAAETPPGPATGGRRRRNRKNKKQATKKAGRRSRSRSSRRS